MKTLFTKHEFDIANGIDLLACKCYICERIFYKTKREIISAMKNSRGHKGKYCSRICMSKDKTTKVKVKCINCNKDFFKRPSQIKKSINNFCSRSCAVTHNNKHKNCGTRRSKLEIWIEDQLTLLYPQIKILYNDKEAIRSELDIFIPTLQLAFELNGVFHYEPIFGNSKLANINKNDVLKSKACIDKKIDLCIIDVSQQKYFKPKTSQKYLDIIVKIINDRL